MPVPWGDYDAHERSMDYIYRHWREWVDDTYPDDFQIRRRCLNARHAEQAAMLTPQACHQFLDLLEETLDECGWRQNGALTDEAGVAIWNTDEKGFEARDSGKLKGQKVLVPKCIGTSASASVQEGSFGHITILPYMSLRSSL